jgi:hypothetical protein
MDNLAREELKQCTRTHSTLVTPLTWPSNQRTADLVSKSQIAAEPSPRPAATYRPEGSNRANDAPATSDV